MLIGQPKQKPVLRRGFVLVFVCEIGLFELLNYICNPNAAIFSAVLYTTDMSNNLSANRLIRNEQIIRNRNTALKKDLKKQFAGTKKAQFAPVSFICECSALDCTAKIVLTIEAYERIHQQKDQFVLAKGHEIEQIESVSRELPAFNIVEKEELAS